MPKQVWTAYRRLMSNLVPALFCVPVFVIGILFYQSGNHTLAIVLVAATPVIGWIAVNYFGLFQNRQMMVELSPQLRAKHPDRASSAIFAGFSRPAHHSPIDAHEDVGWFLILPDSVEFIGERYTYEMKKSEVVGVRFRFNAHTILGLGRWISIDGKREGKDVRMLIEPRQQRTLIGNKRLGSKLLKQLRDWAMGNA